MTPNDLYVTSSKLSDFANKNNLLCRANVINGDHFIDIHSKNLSFNVMLSVDKNGKLLAMANEDNRVKLDRRSWDNLDRLYTHICNSYS